MNDDVTVVLPGLGGLQTSQQSTLGGGLFNKGFGPQGGLGTGLSKSGNDPTVFKFIHCTAEVSRIVIKGSVVPLISF